MRNQVFGFHGVEDDLKFDLILAKNSNMCPGYIIFLEVKRHVVIIVQIPEKCTSFSRFINPAFALKMWKTAIEQAVFATGIGFGTFITIASYNKRTNNLVG